MDEIIAQVDLSKLSKSLRKHRYEVVYDDRSIAIVSEHKKPRSLIIYLMLFFGVMRLAQQKMGHAMMSFTLAVLAIILNQYENKRYNLTYSDVSKILVSEDNIQLNFKSNLPSIKLTTEQIASITVSISYDGNTTLAALLLEDNMKSVYNLLNIAHKSEDAAKELADETLQAIMEKMGAESA